MRRNVFAVLALALLLTASALRGEEPGIPALIEKLNNVDAAARLAAVKQLRSAGPAAAAAVPALIDSLKDADWDVRMEAAETLLSIGPAAMSALLTAATGPASEVRSGATWVVARLRVECLPGLLQLLVEGKPEVKTLAAHAIDRIGPASIPALRAALAQDDDDLRADVATLLGGFGVAAKETVPDLIEALKHKPGTPTHQRIAAALGKIGPEAVPALTAALQNDFWEIRTGAALALGFVPPQTPQVLPALIAALQDDRACVREAAARSLANIGPPAVSALPGLFTRLKDETTEVRVRATEALAAIAPNDRAVVNELLAGLKDIDIPVRVKSLEALGYADTVASEIVPVVLEATHDDEPALRAQAMKTLETLLPRPEAKDIYLGLVEGVDDKNAEVRLHALSALAKVLVVPASVPAGKEPDLPKENQLVVYAALAHALGDELPGVRARAVEIMGHLPAAAEAAVPIFVGALKDAVPIVRQRAIDSLGELGAAARPAMPCLIAALQEGADAVLLGESIRKIGLDPKTDITLLLEALPSKTPEGSAQIATLLASLGQAANEAIPKLLQGAYDKTGALGPAMAEVLKQIDPENKATIPALTVRVKSKVPEVRLSAIEHLRTLGPAAAPAVPALIDVLKDDEYLTREAAIHALAAIAPPDAKTVAAIIVSMRCGVGKVLRAGSAALAKAAPDALPAIVAGLKDDIPAVRTTLFALLEKTPAAIPLLAAAMKDAPIVQRRAIILLVAQMGPAAKGAAPALVEALKDGSTTTLSYVAKAIEAIGPDAVPALSAAIKEGTPEQKRLAMTLVVQMGQAAKGAAPALAAAMTDENALTKAQALRALEKLGPHGIAGLTAAIGQADLPTKLLAIAALGNLGATAKTAVPVLLPLQKDEQPKVRRYAINSLRQIAPENPQVLAAIQAAAKDEDPTVKMAAIKNLGSMGALAKDGIPSIIEALRDEDWDIRMAAATALEDIGQAAKRVFTDMMPTINEIYAVSACVAYGRAQEAYRQKDYDHDGILEYATAIKGTGPKKKLGLSDVALLPRWYADAELGGYYRGYKLKILTGQGEKATGGVKSYLDNGKLTGGHAILVYPAEYGKLGRCVYMMNHTGAIYEKDFRTAAATTQFVTSATAYSPDESWTLTRQVYLAPAVPKGVVPEKGVEKKENTPF
ncbi:MAG TPA: DUF2950 family protein [Planctomycetota bacterium]